MSAGGHRAEHLNAVAGTGGTDVGIAMGTLVPHTLAMYVASIEIGVDVLRKAWVNIDMVWIGTLAFAGAITPGFGLWSIAG